MAALSAVTFALSWWLGLYLVARDPRKPVLALAALGLCGYAVVLALDTVRLATPAHAEMLGRVEIYLMAVPGVAWLAVLLELARPDGWRPTGKAAVVLVAIVALIGAAMAGGVTGPLRPGHWLMFVAISGSTLVAMVLAVRRAPRPRSIVGVVVVATLFFALANAILLIPLGLLPSWVALGSMGTGADVMLLGLAVAVWDAFDEGHTLRADMRRSFIGTMAVSVVFGAQALAALAVAGPGARPVLTVLMFSIIAVAIAITVLADPLAGLLDRLAFARSPELRADRAVLRETETALPLRATNPLDALDDDTFARLTRRALGHYGNLSKLVASPLTALPVIDDRLAARGAPDQPLERANELKAVLADRISALKPREGGEFGVTEEWRHYNALYFPYVVGVRAYAQNATAAGLDPVARQAWQWLVTDVPQRSLHNWQNAAARVIAADLRGRALSLS